MRSYNRFTTDQEIDCLIGRTKHKVALYNLSCGGCMIETPDDDAVEGASVKIVLTGKAVMPGKIAWRVGKNAGVKFDLPLHQKVVEHFGYSDDEEFDRDDPRDRFGIPLVEVRSMAAGMIE
ncbi:MAG: PilZ domain-containing protein [Pontixanthobacter sp.]